VVGFVRAGNDPTFFVVEDVLRSLKSETSRSVLCDEASRTFLVSEEERSLPEASRAACSVFVLPLFFASNEELSL